MLTVTTAASGGCCIISVFSVGSINAQRSITDDIKIAVRDVDSINVCGGLEGIGASFTYDINSSRRARVVKLEIMYINVFEEDIHCG